jgi:hypothetical protein
MNEEQKKIYEQTKKEIVEELKEWLLGEIRAGRIKLSSEKTPEKNEDKDPLRRKELGMVTNRWTND